MSLAASRLKEAMADRGVDQPTLARAVGVTQGAISLILRGRTQRSKHLFAIANYLGVSVSWLAGIDDVKYPEGPEQMLLGPKERRLVENYRQVTPIAQATIDRIANALLIENEVMVSSVLLRRQVEQSSSEAEASKSGSRTDLPEEQHLQAMFEGVLLGIDRNAPLDVQARQLAQSLPTALARLQGVRLAPARSAPATPADAPADPAFAATHDPGAPR